MNESIRPEKEDRYRLDSSVKKPLSPKSNNPLLSKKKWIILVLMLCIILLLISFAIFKPERRQETLPTNSAEQNTINSAKPNEYQALAPPKISRSATETKQDNGPAKERVEIPGEVTDLLASKITELNEKDQSANTVVLTDESSNINKKANELPLQKKLANNHYTIQISSSSSIESMMAFVKQHKLANYQIYETRRAQNPWFVLIKGDYSTIEDAREAIKLLPKELQKSAPWIKSGEVVNKEKTLK